MTIFERSVLTVDHPEVTQGMTPQHRVRPLMPAAMRGDYAATDPFLALMEDWFPRGVFGKHPHRGIETVTYVLEGQIDHYDNHGNAGTILPCDAQWMTAGRGLIHNEIPAEGVVAHSLQLWVNLPAADKMTAPRYQDLVGAATPTRCEPGVEVRVFSGESGGVISPTKNYVPVTMIEIRLDAFAHVLQDLPADFNAVIVVLDGEGIAGVDRKSIVAGDVAWLTRRDREGPSSVAIAARKGPLRALLYAGRPLREPVVAGRPFVMNTQAEIEQAYADYRAGRFGPPYAAARFEINPGRAATNRRSFTKISAGFAYFAATRRIPRVESRRQAVGTGTRAMVRMRVEAGSALSEECTVLPTRKHRDAKLEAPTRLRLPACLFKFSRAPRSVDTRPSQSESQPTTVPTRQTSRG